MMRFAGLGANRGAPVVLGVALVDYAAFGKSRGATRTAALLLSSLRQAHSCEVAVPQPR